MTRSSTTILKIGMVLKVTGAMTIGAMTTGAMMIGVMTTQTPAVAAHVLTTILMTTPRNPQSQQVDARTLATRTMEQAAENGAKTLVCGLVDCGQSRKKTTEEPERKAAPITMMMMNLHLIATQSSRSMMNGVHGVIHGAAPSMVIMIAKLTCATGAPKTTSLVYANLSVKVRTQ